MLSVACTSISLHFIWFYGSCEFIYGKHICRLYEAILECSGIWLTAEEGKHCDQDNKDDESSPKELMDNSNEGCSEIQTKSIYIFCIEIYLYKYSHVNLLCNHSSHTCDQ